MSEIARSVIAFRAESTNCQLTASTHEEWSSVATSGPPHEGERPESQEGTRLRARWPGADPRTERRTWASSQGPSRQSFLGKVVVFSSWACLCAGVRLLAFLSGSWVACVVFARCLSRLWSCLPLLVPCCFWICVSPCGCRPEDPHCFGGTSLVEYHSLRRVGSIVRMPRRIVVRAVTSAHAS